MVDLILAHHQQQVKRENTIKRKRYQMNATKTKSR